MYDPKLYHSADQIQQRDARVTLSRCPFVKDWHTGSLLDIGSGSGDVTMEIVAKALPKNFERLVGVDRSEKMVQFASEHYSHPNVSFKLLDIGLELEEQEFRELPFDHITSFNCLHWVTKSQPTTVKNMFKLLKPGGDMLLIFVVTHPIYEVFKELAIMDNWKGYMKDVEDILSPYFYSIDPAGEYEQLLQSNGFIATNVTVRDLSYNFEKVKDLRDTYAAVNPFLAGIPDHQKEMHMDDLVRLLIKRRTPQIVGDGILLEYKSIVAYARKPNGSAATSHGHALPSTSSD